MISKRRYSTKRLISTTMSDELYADVKKKGWRLSDLLAIGYRHKRDETSTQVKIKYLEENQQRLETANKIIQGRLLQEAAAREELLKNGRACPNCGLKH